MSTENYHEKKEAFDKAKEELQSAGVMTPQLMQLKINGEITRNKLTIDDLEKRALEVVKNRDNLKVMTDILKDGKRIKDIAEGVFTKVKKPFWESGKACDAGKKLVFDQVDRICGMVQADHDRLLRELAEETRLANLKKDQDAAILKGIEENTIVFSNKIIAAITRKDLSAVESLINLQKSPSMAKKYGEFHAQAIARYDAVLLPIIKDQKDKVEELEKLNKQVLEAEAHNDPETMDLLNEKIDGISNQILQNHSVIQDAALYQDSFPITIGTEVLPDFKVKRTNYSMEIVDVEVAWKKARELLEVGINKETAKVVLQKLKDDGEFDDKDEVVVNGIKYIATRVREAL